MAFDIDDSFNIRLYQGDSDYLEIYNLPTDKNYILYFAIQNKKRQPIGDEISMETNHRDFLSIIIPSSLTDLLTVPQGQETEEYYYGIKICDPETGIETTLVLQNNSFEDLNTLTVLPRKSKGLQNE